MKHQSLFFITLLTAMFIASCGGDDGDEVPAATTLTVFDFSTTIPNHSNTGFEVGQIEASSSSSTRITYELVSESVPGALSVAANNGRILVADGALIDFELNPIISATVEVTQGDAVNVAAISISVDALTSFQLEAVDYFKDIALGFEFGNNSEITRKWRTTMRVFVTGSPSTELIDELNSIIEELRTLITDGFEIELVNSRAESNYVVVIGSANQYVQLFPDAANLVAGNLGLFFVNWDSDQYLNTGHMYVDIERANQLAQRHLLREEFTQSLGLAKDSDEFINSIFQSEWTTTTSYTELDRELIRLLYHPDMTSGLNATQVEVLLRQILTSD